MTPSAPAIHTGRNRLPQQLFASRLRELATLLVCAVMLSGVALFAGYPLVYADTGSYLAFHSFPPRSFCYNLFLAPEHLTRTLWTAVPLQAVLIAYMLRLVLREVFALTSRIEFLAIVFVLCMLTSLPWIVGFVMPDIFTPMLVLGMFMLAFCFEHLSRGERCFIVAMIFVSVVVQYSHPPLAVGLLVAALVVRMMWRGRAPIAISHQGLAATLIAAGVAAIVILNYFMIDMATFSPAGYAFELSRLIENRSAEAYLRENCPTHKYAACAYLDRMPMTSTDFLWAPDSIFRKVGWLGERKEGTEIIRGTIETHPLWVLSDAIGDTISQLTLVETGVGLDPAATNYSTADGIRLHFPNDVEAFQDSRQGRGEFVHLPRLQRLHLGVVAIALCWCCFVAALFARDREWLPIALMMTVGLAIVGNAFVTGAISQPHPRYGARLVWLIPLIALASWRKVASVRRPT
jgi:hypothetical protein